MASKTSRTLTWIILGLVMVGLVGFGSTNFGGSVSSIGTVGDTNIDANQYFRELNAEINAFQAATGQSLPITQAQALGVDQQVLARVISAAALENETKQLGISVGDEEVRRQLVQIRDFQGVDGNFDREAYSFVLDQSRLTATEFEENLRADTARTILQAAVAGGVTTSPTYVDTLFNYARESRDFTWAVLEPSLLDAPVSNPTDADLTGYYEAHADAFTLPETKKITYTWLNPEDLIAGIEVDEADIRTLYDDRIDEFVVPERRIVERLVFGTLAEAQAAADALAAGEIDFETLVRDRGLSLSDLDLGDVSKADLEDAGDAVFALSEPGIAGPATSNIGPALYRMNAILAARETSYDTAREELVGEFAADRARRKVADLVPELDDLLASGSTLEELSAEHNLSLGQVDWFFGQDAGIAAYESFSAAAAVTTQDDFPEITLMADGGVFAQRVDDVVAPRLQDLDVVRADVITGWLADESARLLKVQAEAYLPRFVGGDSPSSLGLTEIQENKLTREAFVDGTPADFMNLVFEMSPGAWQVVENESGVILVRLDAVNPADHASEEASALKSSFAERTAQEIGLDIEAAFSAALQSAAGITLNRPVINAIHSQFP